MSWSRYHQPRLCCRHAPCLMFPCLSVVPSILCSGRVTATALFLPPALTCVLWVSLLASLCLPGSFTCKWGWDAFLESSQRKICVEVFRKWRRIIEKSGGLFFLFFSFSWPQMRTRNVWTISFASFHYFFLLCIFPQLQLTCPPFSLFSLLRFALDL